MVLIRGSSSTGKTRTAYEALRASVSDDFTLVYPTDAARLSELLDADSARPRTVLWLNDAQDHFTGSAGEAAADALLRRLDGPGPLIVIATLWPEYDDMLTARPSPGGDDPHRNARALLTKVPRIHLPDSFTADLEAVRAAADADPSLAAVLSLGSSDITQALSAAPDLVRHYEQPAGREGPYGQALISAAMDAHRLGDTTLLHLDFLKAAAPGYMTDAQRADATDDWFDGALRYARTKVKQIAAPLQNAALDWGMGAQPDVVRLADYLQQHGGHTRRWLCPPESFWRAAYEHFHAESLVRLGTAAHERHRINWAYRLHERAAEIGDQHVLMYLASKARREGYPARAEALYQQAAAAGSTDAAFQVAYLLERSDPAEAERLYQQLADEGSAGGMLALANRRAMSGDRDGATQLYQQAADAGSTVGIVHLAQERMARGDLEGAKRLYELAVEAGDVGALLNLTYLRDDEGDREGAERAAVQAVIAGDTNPVLVLSYRREAAGDREGAQRLYRHAADAGHLGFLLQLASHHRDAEEDKEQNRQRAERLYQLIADAGNIMGLLQLGEMRRNDGDLSGAEQFFQQAVDADCSVALSDLALIRLMAKDRLGARHLYQQAADAGESAPLSSLIWMWEEQEGVEAADRALAQAADAGNISAVLELAERRGGAGDREVAEQLYYRAADAGHPSAVLRLVLMRETAGDYEGAEQAAFDADDAGHTRVLLELVKLRQRAQDSRDVVRLLERAADPGNSGHLFHGVEALAQLVRIRANAGEHEGAVRALLQATNAGIRGLGNESLEWQYLRSAACDQWPHGLEPDGSPSAPC
ncbi:hypothetical protein [Streptomyces mirabilis]